MKTSVPLRFTRRAASSGPAPGSPPPGAELAHEFKRSIMPHLDGAYNLARYLTRDPVLSEDVVQDAFVRALRGYGQFRGGSARAWLFAIVRNCCRTAQAGRSGALALVVHESSLNAEDALLMERQPDLGPSPEDEVIQRTEAERLRQAIEAIPEPFREAIVLRELEDLSYGEIAEVTGVPVGTVMSRLSRGRSMLATALLPPKADDGEASRSIK